MELAIVFNYCQFEGKWDDAFVIYPPYRLFSNFLAKNLRSLKEVREDERKK